MTSASRPAKSASDLTSPVAGSGSENAGVAVPRGNMVDGVSAKARHPSQVSGNWDSTPRSDAGVPVPPIGAGDRGRLVEPRYRRRLDRGPNHSYRNSQGPWRGNAVMRIVSLACSNTEIVCALGCADLLVGVDDHSDFPEAVVGVLPKVGPDLQIDVDRVSALNPDLVLATLTVPGHEAVVERLERAGLPFIAPEPVSLADVYEDIREIASRLAPASPGVQARAERLITEMRTEFDPSSSEGLPDLGTADDRRPLILVQWWPKPVITPGRRSWATEVIEAAGGRALLGHEDHKSRPMTDLEVAEAAPDAVVLSWCGVHPDKYRPDVVLGNPSWQHLDFVTHRRVFCIGEPFLGRPGPRLVEGVRAMRQVTASLGARVRLA